MLLGARDEHGVPLTDTEIGDEVAPRHSRAPDPDWMTPKEADRRFVPRRSDWVINGPAEALAQVRTGGCTARDLNPEPAD